MVELDLLIVTFIMIVLDVVLGFAGAVKEKNVQSVKLREGLWHKAGFIGLIALGFVLQYAATIANLGYDIPAVDVICIYVILTEAVSAVENLCVLNPNLINSPLGSIFKHGDKIEEAEELELLNEESEM